MAEEYLFGVHLEAACVSEIPDRCMAEAECLWELELAVDGIPEDVGLSRCSTRDLL